MAQDANRIESKGSIIRAEYNAGEADIVPGMLLTLTSDDEVIKHAVEGGVLGDENMFAMEDALKGAGLSTAYTLGEKVQVLIPVVGAEIRMLVEDAQDISIGEKLCSAGNGLIKSTSDLESGETLAKVNGIATEVNDLTGSNTSNTLSRVRIV